VGDEAVHRLVVEFHGHSHLLEDALVEHGNPVRDGVGLFLVVGDEDGGEREFALQVENLAAHLHAQVGVEVRERLIEQEHAGFDDDGAGEGDALLLTAGQLRGTPLGKLQESDHVECGVDALRDLGRGRPAFFQAEGDVPAHRHVRPQRIGLEHHADVAPPGRQMRYVVVTDEDAPPGRRPEAGDGAQQGRFARPRRTQEGEQLARLDAQVHVFQHVGRIVGEAQLLDDDAGGVLRCHTHTPATMAMSGVCRVSLRWMMRCET